MRNQLFGLVLLISSTAGAQTKIMLDVGVNRSKVTPNYTMLPDTVNRTVTQRTGLSIGFSAYIPIDQHNRLIFNPGIRYSGNGSKVHQTFDTSHHIHKLVYMTTDQKINYINVPLNVLYRLPLKGKTGVLVGGGPQFSLFYNGEVTVTTFDTSKKFKEVKDEDPLVGKGVNKYATFFLSANAKAGVDFGRISLMASYSKGLTAFYKTGEQDFKNDNLALILGIGLNSNGTKKKIVKDQDQDGVPDKEDACSTQAGSALTNGCPDTDGDSIADKDDRCAAIAGLKKYNGCPIPDTDKDGINDEEDRCPTIAGVPENRGCPEEKAKPVETDPKPVITEKAAEQIRFAAKQIQFRFRQADLTEESYKLLDNIAAILQTSNQEITVEGHSSLEGNPKSNQSLSEQRAESVKKYLVQKGIAPERIMAIGYGSSRPLVKGTTEKANVQNRRVEIKLAD